jgi:hypothetical protein
MSSYQRLEKKSFRRQIGRYRPAFNGKYLLLFTRSKNGIIYSVFALLFTFTVFISKICPALSKQNLSSFLITLYGLWVTVITVVTSILLMLTWLTEPGVCVNTNVHHIYKNDGRPHSDQPKWVQSFLRGLQRGRGDSSPNHSIDSQNSRLHNKIQRPKNRHVLGTSAPAANLGTELVDLDFPVCISSDSSVSNGQMNVLDRRLLLSTADGDEDTVRILLEMGAQPNVTNSQLRSPLHLAGYRGYTDIVVLLLKRGAICGRSDSFGLSELHYALVNGHDSTAEILINHGSSLQNENDGNSIDGKKEDEKESKQKSIPDIDTVTLNSLRDKAIVATNAALSRHMNEKNHSLLSPTRQSCEQSRRQQSPPLSKRKCIATDDGSQTELMWCHVCQHFKPMLAHHSETCEVCIDGFEQHCLFVSNAIGKRNYKYYVGLLIASSLLSLSCLMPSMVVTFHQALVVTENGNGILDKYVWETILVLWCLIVSVPLCSLACYHITAIIWGLPTAYAAYTNVKGRRYQQTQGNNGNKIGTLVRLFHTPLMQSEALETLTATTETISSNHDDYSDDERDGLDQEV